MDWVSLLALLSVFHFRSFAVLENGNGKKRFKRLIYGLDLSGVNQLSTFYMVALKKFHGCENAAEVKRDPKCDKYDHQCGGSLIAPDFVLTACHCIIYETYEVEGNPLPDFSETFEKFTTSTSPKPNVTVKKIFVRSQPLHPLHILLSLWMGDVDTTKMSQRQFAKALIPHSLCLWREVTFLAGSDPSYQEYLLEKYPSQFDVGVVRTWKSFILNQFVRIVPMKLGDDLVAFHRKVMKKMFVCLFTGFGDTETGEVSRFLRYTFRHPMCTTECMENPGKASECEICTTSISRPDKGIRIAKMGPGDSGGPLVCDEGSKINWLIGVLSVQEVPRKAREVNATNAIFTSIVCIREFLTTDHIKYLRNRDENSYAGIKFDDVPMGPYSQN